jgi:hypothetical protein
MNYYRLRGDAKLPPVEIQQEEANSSLRGVGIEVQPKGSRGILKSPYASILIRYCNKIT